MDLIGFIPVIGDIVDGVNAVIYLMRGDFKNAIISGIAVFPVIGDAAKGLKYIDKASDVLKFGSKAVDIGKSTAKVAGKKVEKAVKKYALDIASKGEKAFSKVLDASIDLGKGDYIGYIKGKGETFLSKVNDKLPDSIALCLQGGCLLGDTLVRTEIGFKSIRDIEKGELVLSKNNEKGTKEYKRVLEVHRNSTNEICIIKTRNGKIKSTTGHLFMIKDKWWTAAIDIKEKDLIEVNKEIYEEVEEIEVKKYKYPIRVCNLEIEENHTYYTGDEEILTHNMGNMNPCVLGDITRGG